MSRDATGTPDQLSFDVIVVGAGPSAAGLLRGLLLQILDGSDIRIAVLERGAGETSHESAAPKTAASGQEAKTEGPRRFRHPHPSAHSLREWFTATHYTSRASNHILGTSDKDPSYTSKNNNATASPTVLHTTTPQPHLNQRILDVPTGTGWGGTTNIHAGLVVEPEYGRDFDTWPGRWKGGALMKGAVKEVLGVLKEERALSVGSLTGTKKLDCGNDTEKCRSFVEVFSERKDCSAEALDWCGKFHEATTSSTSVAALSHNDAAIPATRVNFFSALVGPLLQKHPELESSVTFLSGMQVERVLVGAEGDHSESGDASVEEYRAYAVECHVSNGTALSDNERVTICAKREIVLCAGAISSPALLLASGIGHEDDLKRACIAPWYDRLEDQCNIPQSVRRLPVGRNLRDHVVLPRTFVTPRQRRATMSRNSIHGWWLFNHGDAKIQLQLADGIQMDRMIPHFASMALRRNWRLALIHSMRHSLRRLLQAIFDLPLIRGSTRLHTASVNVCLLNPQSTGKVTLLRGAESASPARLSQCQLAIDPGYLSNPRDLDALWTGWNASDAIKQRWFRGCIEILPGVAVVVFFSAISYLRSMICWLVWPHWDGSVKAKEQREVRPTWFDGYAADFTNPYYHWCGTCAMGEELAEDDRYDASSFVVDEQLCVQGIAGLRICDASVFPCCVSAPTALTCAGLGYAASSLIGEKA